MDYFHGLTQDEVFHILLDWIAEAPADCAMLSTRDHFAHWLTESLIELSPNRAITECEGEAFRLATTHYLHLV